MYKKFIVLLLAIIISLPIIAEENPITIKGFVRGEALKNDLPKARMYVLDADGNRADTIQVGITLHTPQGAIETSMFVYQTVRNDSTYVFDVECDGYMPKTVVYKVEGVGAREWMREMPEILLEKAPHNLGEVTVTASKIKFYNRGDTLVYNADAFQLAEGSMLDALIEQLPGVELNDKGQIKVNGEFVESLLLNGKQFFDGNNNLMLQNLGAYTVKNVEVYRGQTLMERWIDDPNAPKHLTMDVKLKKEYNIGWLVNAQGGYGTEDRYLGRLFASWFNPTTNVALIGSINNLNDERTPGKNDNWTPELMPSGTRRYKMGGLNYSYQSADMGTGLNGNVVYTDNRLDSRTKVDRTNFFSGQNTYDYAFNNTLSTDRRLSTKHDGFMALGRFSLSGNADGYYNRTDLRRASISASFKEEQAGVTMEGLEAIYSDGSEASLASIINRSITRNDGSTKSGGAAVSLSTLYKIPKTTDMIRGKVSVKYDTKKEYLWNDYDINYGRDTQNGTRQRQYTDNTPNHDLNLEGTLVYLTRIKGGTASLSYTYSFHNRERDSYTYMLDRLEEMGIYGTLPSGYLSTLDAGNSFRSSLLENKHTINPGIGLSKDYDNGNRLYLSIKPEFGLLHSHLNYRSDGKSYPVRRTSFVTAISSYGAQIHYTIGGPKVKSTMHMLALDFMMDTETPELIHMVDVENTTNPLDIQLGNEHLRNAYRQDYTLTYSMNYYGRPINNTLQLNYSPTANALVRGYAYDMTTGIRRTRTYNVRGTCSMTATNTYSMQFGSMKQFTLSSTTEAANIHSVDMIGLNAAEPSRSTVNTRNLAEKLNITWQIGKQSLTLKGNITDRRTTSAREGFADIDATHFNYGFNGQFSLPGGFGIGTDFTFYTRRGYGVKELDTTDAVWNARATYTPRGARWVFTLDGFDLLHRLSNVHYAVNASGRTVTYTNTLPRYVLLTVQYRLSIQPKRR